MTTKSSWWSDRIDVPHSQTVIEQEKPSPFVIFDHTGQPLMRPRQPMGFDLLGRNK